MNLQPPDDLSDIAKRKWLVIAKQIEGRAIDMAEEMLIDQLSDYCAAYALKKLARKELAELGSTTVRNANGTVSKAPQLTVIDQAEKTMDRVLRRLGMQQKPGDSAGGDEGIDL